MGNSRNAFDSCIIKQTNATKFKHSWSSMNFMILYMNIHKRLLQIYEGFHAPKQPFSIGRSAPTSPGVLMSFLDVTASLACTPGSKYMYAPGSKPLRFLRKNVSLYRLLDVHIHACFTIMKWYQCQGVVVAKIRHECVTVSQWTQWTHKLHTVHTTRMIHTCYLLVFQVNHINQISADVNIVSWYLAC